MNIAFKDEKLYKDFKINQNNLEIPPEQLKILPKTKIFFDHNRKYEALIDISNEDDFSALLEKYSFYTNDMSINNICV